MAQKINLVICGDSQYFSLAPAYFVNFLNYHKVHDVTLYALCDDLSEIYQEDLRRIAAYFGQEFVYIQINELDFDYLHDYKVQIERFPKQSYYYLLVGKYLPETVERALFTDLDVAFFGDVSDFYQVNFDGNFFIGKPEYNYQDNTTIEAYRQGALVNTGVMMLNVAALRKAGIDSAYFLPMIDNIKDDVLVREGKEHIFFADQGLLAYAFHDRVGIFNSPMLKHGRPDFNSKIVHFVGYVKTLFKSEMFENIYSDNVEFIYPIQYARIFSQVITGKLDKFQVLEFFNQSFKNAIRHRNFIFTQEKNLNMWERLPSKYLVSYVLHHNGGIERLNFRFSPYFRPMASHYQIKLLVRTSVAIQGFGLVGFTLGRATRLTEFNLLENEVKELSAIIDFNEKWTGIGISSHNVPNGAKIDIIDIAIEEV
ncbi:hypothetical protein Hs30E_15110 [Lactococcus hodotermopsidis]|uniref:Glycosyl transferase n=1 Tax=Pseudolactococcus hodotermopsidis TaxID=2709157 RepID=A0A6A0BC73_9LACT|nr:glycosyltransferase [Lactococcus hodotermopsidis]GFH42960.1 hypothetical protein Hs30E_15110 [Lactococcus hodotermopsidis]